MKLSCLPIDVIFEVSRYYNTSIPDGLSHTFIVDKSVAEFALQTSMIEREGAVSWADVNTPMDAKRHGQLTVLAIPNLDNTYIVVGFDEEKSRPAGDSKNIVFLVSDDERTNKGVGYFFPGGPVHIFKEFAEDDPIVGNRICNIMVVASFVMSLINQPRMVSTSKALSRQQRRFIDRKYGPSGSKNVNIVKWDVSKSSAASHAASNGGVEGKALHWRRGHWRRAQENWKGAVQRPDALRPEERDLWWQWIEGMWVGHPAYGFVQSVHAPKMSTTEMFKRGSK